MAKTATKLPSPVGSIHEIREDVPAGALVTVPANTKIEVPAKAQEPEPVVLDVGMHLGIDAELYHSDPCPEPSLSSSLAYTMVTKSPAHGWAAHPRLNPLPESKSSARMDLGTVAHTLVLGAGRDIAVLDFDNWTTKAAKAARDEARAEGKTPILIGAYESAQGLVGVLGHELARRGLEESFNRAHKEAVFIWREGDAYCRAMIDAVDLHEKLEVPVYDYKTTEDASPENLARHIVNMGYDLKAAFYCRGVERVHPHLAGRTRFRWIFQETKAPFAVTVAELDGEGVTIGERKAAAAIHLWQRGMSLGSFPAYPAAVARLDYPTWEASRWNEREANDRALAGVEYFG